MGYELADLGSRFTALLLDGLLLFSILLVLWIGAPILVLWIGGLPDALMSIGAALLVIASFLVLWGYFVYFEGFRDGQTPGKRLLGLRVIQDGGYPLGVREALVRNLLRAVDVLPPPSWLVGGVVMMLHPRTKRLGDIAAGTVVVRERGEFALSLESDDREPVGAPRLTEEEYSAVARYVARRKELPQDARTRLAAQLLDRLIPRFTTDPRTGRYSSDAILVGLHEEEAGRRAAGGRAAGTLQATGLVRAKGRSWTEYRELLGRAGKRGLAGLPEADVSRFAALYRETAADLARARTYGAAPELIYSLERWVGAGHNLLYRPGARSALSFLRWLGSGFPALVRKRWQPIALAALIFFGPMVATGVSIYSDPVRARALLPAAMLARAEEGAVRQAAGQGYLDVPEMGMPLIASYIISNNVQVTIVAFAGGIAAGLGTIAALLFNGVFIGGVFGLFAAYDLGAYLLAFVLPHGVIELSAICIAGGAGLWLGSALVLPGRVTRGQAIVERGREAVALLGGTAVLLLVAGLIEGFISPAPFPLPVKASVSLFSAVALAAYLLLGGRAPSGAGSE